MRLPIDLLPARVLRLLAEYHPNRAMEALRVAGHPGELPDTAAVLLARWIQDGSELIEMGAEAVKTLAGVAPRIGSACAQERRVTGILLQGGGEQQLYLVRPLGDALEIGLWSSIAGQDPATAPVERLDILTICTGNHSFRSAPSILAAITTGFCAARETALLPSIESRASSRRHGRRGHPPDHPRARRLLLDPSLLMSWLRPSAPRSEPRTTPTAVTTPTPRAAMGIHHVAQHLRGQWVHEPNPGEEVLDLRYGAHGTILCLVHRPVAPHARGSTRLHVRRSRLTTGPEDLRT